MSYLLVFIFSYLAASLAAFVMMKIAITDSPVSRSSHSVPTPTAGGVSIAAAALVSILVLKALDLSLGGLGAVSTPWVLGGVLTVAAMGLLDDILHFGSKIKFLAMMIIAGLTIYALGPVQSMPLGGGGVSLPAWLGYFGGALWIFTVMNVVNFMDGADGMLGLNMMTATAGLVLFILISAATHGAAPVSLFWAFSLMAGLCGFIQFNARKGAKIFAGDVGSLSIGYLYAVIVLLAAAELPDTGALYLGPLFMLPFFVDVFLTLIRRVRGGHNVLVAHNTHLFQRLIRGGRSHIRVSIYYAFAGLACVGIGLFAEVLSFARSPFVILAVSAAAIAVYHLVFKTKGQV